MKKYWLLAVTFVFAIAIGTIVIRTLATREDPVVASDGHYTTASAQMTSAPINPSEYIRRLTETPKRIPTIQIKPITKPITTVNPTEYIRRLTEIPKRIPTGVTLKKPVTAINPSEYIRQLTEAPKRLPTVRVERETLRPTVHMQEPNSTSSAHTEVKEVERNFFASTSSSLQEKLPALKLRICEERSKEIIQRSISLAEMIEKMLGKLTSIAMGVQEYYVKKNISIANYSELVAAIETKKAAISPLLSAMKTDMKSFSCSMENPSIQLKKQRVDTELVLGALHEYRTTIKNLIEAIKELGKISVTPTGTI